MKRTGIFPVFALLAAIGLFAASAIQTLGYFSAEAAAAEQRKADYQAALQALCIKTSQELLMVPPLFYFKIYHGIQKIRAVRIYCLSSEHALRAHSSKLCFGVSERT